MRGWRDVGDNIIVYGNLFLVILLGFLMVVCSYRFYIY